MITSGQLAIDMGSYNVAVLDCVLNMGYSKVTYFRLDPCLLHALRLIDIFITLTRII